MIQHQGVDEVQADARDDHAGDGAAELLGDRRRSIAGARHVGTAGLQRRRPRAALRDDEIPDAIEVRAALDEVVGIALEVDGLAALPFLEAERSGTHAARALLRDGDVGGQDRRVTAREHEQQRRLRALEPEHHGVRVGGLDRLDVVVPLLAGIDPEFRRRVGRLAHHVEGELDVARGERLAVVPRDAAPQEEDEVAIAVLPRPLLREIGKDGVEALERLHRVERDEAVEAGLGGPDRRQRGRLVDEESLSQVFPRQHLQHSAGSARSRRGRRRGVDGDGHA